MNDLMTTLNSEVPNRAKMQALAETFIVAPDQAKRVLRAASAAPTLESAKFLNFLNEMYDCEKIVAVNGLLGNNDFLDVFRSAMPGRHIVGPDGTLDIELEAAVEDFDPCCEECGSPDCFDAECQDDRDFCDSCGEPDCNGDCEETCDGCHEYIDECTCSEDFESIYEDDCD